MPYGYAFNLQEAGMKIIIENGNPQEGTYVANKMMGSKCSGFGKVVEIPKEKYEEIKKAHTEFFKHQSYLRKIYKDLD